MRFSRGYSLLEILVTLTVALILAGAAVTSFAYIKALSADNEARTALDRVAMAERAWVARNATWADDPSVLNVGRGLVVTQSASGSPTVVSIAVNNDNELGVAVMSETGTCMARVLGDPLLDGGETSFEMPSGSACSGVGALSGP